MLILKGLCTGARHPRRGYRLEHLDLSRNLLTPEVAPLLADALIVLTSLRSLHLAENRLRDPGAIAIAGSMHNVGGPLEKLDLRSNEIGSRGMHALAKALIGGHTQSNAAASLTDLDLGRNSYVWSMVQVKALATHSIHVCGLWCRLGDSGATALAFALPKVPLLARLDLSQTDISREGQAKLSMVLSKCPSLQHLALGGNDYTAPKDYELIDVAPDQDVTPTQSSDAGGVASTAPGADAARGTAQVPATPAPHSTSDALSAARRAYGAARPRSASPHKRRGAVPGGSTRGTQASPQHAGFASKKGEQNQARRVDGHRRVVVPFGKAAARIEAYGYHPVKAKGIPTRMLLSTLAAVRQLRCLDLRKALLGEAPTKMLARSLAGCGQLEELNISGA